jgi:hypothetical protein
VQVRATSDRRAPVPPSPRLPLETQQAEGGADIVLFLIVLAGVVMLGAALIPAPSVLRLRVAPSQIVVWRIGVGAVGASVALGYLIAQSVSGAP